MANSNAKIRAGVIGASPGGTWGGIAHLPALAACEDYRVAAVSTTREASARKAAEVAGAAHAFTSADALARCADVDLVVVSVKCPDHFAAVGAALDARKHVYCEWPLAPTTREAEQLLRQATAAGVRHCIGLQSRVLPELLHARDLVREGYVGRVTSVSVRSATRFFAGSEITAHIEYALDPAAGASWVRIAGGHTLDAVDFLVGPVVAVSAAISDIERHFAIAGTDRQVTTRAPTQMLVQATLADGAVAMVEVIVDRLANAHSLVEISGTEGLIAVRSEGTDCNHLLQVSPMEVFGTRQAGGALERLPTPDRYRAGPIADAHGAPFNVANMYARFAQAIRHGRDTDDVPDFATAVRLHRLLDAVELSAETGRRISIA